MKIALLGASGRVGQRITMEALVRGHEVKALVRKPERFPIAHPRLTVARVDIFDPASVAEAIADSDVVMNATGAGGSDPHTFFVNSSKAVIEGVKRAGGNKRLIVVGGAGSLEVAPASNSSTHLASPMQHARYRRHSVKHWTSYALLISLGPFSAPPNTSRQEDGLGSIASALTTY